MGDWHVGWRWPISFICTQLEWPHNCVDLSNFSSWLLSLAVDHLTNYIHSGYSWSLFFFFLSPIQLDQSNSLAYGNTLYLVSVWVVWTLTSSSVLTSSMSSLKTALKVCLLYVYMYTHIVLEHSSGKWTKRNYMYVHVHVYMQSELIFNNAYCVIEDQ